MAECPVCGETMREIISKPYPQAKGPEGYECSRHGEFEQVTLLLPKAVLEFLKTMHDVGLMRRTPKDYLTNSVLGAVSSDIHDLNNPILNSETVIEHYNLKAVLKRYL